MKARPIIFGWPMVWALLSGQKTQMRRIAKALDECPYGKHGDLLWVRETWQYADWAEDGDPLIRYRADCARRLIKKTPDAWGEKLSDIWADLSEPANYAIDNRAADRRWRSPVTMPRWASRLTLRITDVRVQRMQDISVEDAMDDWFDPAWEASLAKESARTNPWVWAITFEVIKENVDIVMGVEG